MKTLALTPEQQAVRAHRLDRFKALEQAKRVHQEQETRQKKERRKADKKQELETLRIEYQEEQTAIRERLLSTGAASPSRKTTTAIQSRVKELLGEIARGMVEAVTLGERTGYTTLPVQNQIDRVLVAVAQVTILDSSAICPDSKEQALIGMLESRLITLEKGGV